VMPLSAGSACLRSGIPLDLGLGPSPVDPPEGGCLGHTFEGVARRTWLPGSPRLGRAARRVPVELPQACVTSSANAQTTNVRERL
jgi:hypothetical protein